MYNAFAPYEQDFREWWATKEFSGVSPLTRDYLQHLLRARVFAAQRDDPGQTNLLFSLNGGEPLLGPAGDGRARCGDPVRRGG